MNLLKRALAGERLTDIPIIDHHGHLGYFLSGTESLKDESDRIVAEMDNCGINRGVVFACGTEDIVRHNDRIVEGVSYNPERYIMYAYVRQGEDDTCALKELERCNNLGMKGLKIHAAFEQGNIDHARFADIWHFCAEKKWPVIYHGLPLELITQYPKTIFVGAHCIEKAPAPGAVEMLKEYPNYYWCTSSTLCLRNAVEKCVRMGCVDKLLYGSDFPLNSFSVRLGSILAAEIDDDDIKKILGGNAIRLLQLDKEDF